MKGKGHLSRKIAQYGRELVGQKFDLKDTDDRHESPTGYLLNYDGMWYPCKIYTKVHDEKLNVRVTGRDDRDLLVLQAAQRTAGKRVLMLFVDAQVGLCYGNFLDELMKPVEYLSIEFPLEVRTHVGKITYWPIDKMPNFFELTVAQRTHLASMIWENRHDKSQGKLLL